jgi:hypothetical protein
MKAVDGILLAALVSGMASVGCVSHHHHHDEVVVEAEPAPVGYIYEPGYYDRGYYRGDVWYWHDRNGHVMREAREDHERRIHDHRDEGHDRR